MPDITSPDWLRDAVEAALSDFPEGVSVQLVVTHEQGTDGSSLWLIQTRRIQHVGIGSAGGLQLPPSPTAPDILAEIARYLQDKVFDTEPWGEPRPTCPGHPHPPDPKVINGAAVWVCPRDARVLARIGDLS